MHFVSDLSLGTGYLGFAVGMNANNLPTIVKGMLEYQAAPINNFNYEWAYIPLCSQGTSTPQACKFQTCNDVTKTVSEWAKNPAYHTVGTATDVCFQDKLFLNGNSNKALGSMLTILIQVFMLTKPCSILPHPKRQLLSGLLVPAQPVVALKYTSIQLSHALVQKAVQIAKFCHIG